MMGMCQLTSGATTDLSSQVATMSQDTPLVLAARGHLARQLGCPDWLTAPHGQRIGEGLSSSGLSVRKCVLLGVLADWAESVGVNRHTAYRWFREGALPVPAQRVGRLILVKSAGAASPGDVVLYARVSSHDQRADLDRRLPG